jgi:hypothetical protein
MKYIIEGIDIEKVIQENRIRVQRGVIKFTPVEYPDEPVADVKVDPKTVDPDEPVADVKVDPKTVDKKTADIKADTKSATKK